MVSERFVFLKDRMSSKMTVQKYKAVVCMRCTFFHRECAYFDCVYIYCCCCCCILQISDDDDAMSVALRSKRTKATAARQARWSEPKLCLDTEYLQRLDIVSNEAHAFDNLLTAVKYLHKRCLCEWNVCSPAHRAFTVMSQHTRVCRVYRRKCRSQEW